MYELNAVRNASVFTSADWSQSDLRTLCVRDIHHPWQSVYGFSMTVGYLAANQGMILHCREDEIFEIMAQLNDLIGRPEVLNRAYNLLKKLAEETQLKLVRLIELQEKPIAESEISELIESAERMLARPVKQTVAHRLDTCLSPKNPVDEIPGLRKMLARLQVCILALEKVKDQGFHAVVSDRRRQPDRPALEARRNEPILLDGKPSKLTAGCLQPKKYHLTLWAYLVIRGDRGQSKIWN